MELILASKRKQDILNRIYAGILPVVSSYDLPVLSQSLCIPRDRPLGVDQIGRFCADIDGTGMPVFLSEEVGLFGPLYPCWEEQFCREYRGGNAPVWGVIPDGRWISGDIFLAGGDRDDDLECVRTYLHTSLSIPEDTDFKLLIQSIIWTINQHRNISLRPEVQAFVGDIGELILSS